MTKSGVFIGIIGLIIFTLSMTNGDCIKKDVELINNYDDIEIKKLSTIPKKEDLLGTFIVKNDKKTNLELKNDGTYNLIINVCNDYLLLTGNYELRDSKLILKNNSNYHEDLDGNLELSFTIIDSNTIKADESLVCTKQETLFEK